MKIFRLIGMLLIGSSTLFSCSNNEDELPPKEQEQTNQETYTISFNLGGEFISTSETPLSRTEVAPKKIYGINVYYKKDGDTQYQNYAYGLFDNIEDMTISLIGGYKYKFECSMVKNDADTLYHDDSMYYAPFHQGKLNYDIYKGTILENKFNISTTNYIQIQGLKFGETSLKGKRGYNDIANYPQTDRFYGELTDYVPTKNGVANIDLKRTAFGLKFIITPPVDGTLSISAYYGINPNIKVSADDNISESSSMYTFSQVYECWQAEKYSEDFTIQLIWERANGATQTFSKTITVKRNVMTTINVNVNGSTTDSSLGVKEDDTPMGNENVDMNFNGGNLDDNEVTPNV
ncbi:hypothetical protein [Bacteroides ovatus]|jgi:hypothetical protein|uniref:hypothetical protein n=1 Tax=Bacteroides ovatus TaxID=28116 RepID=UPI00216B17A5|nr:hypothetical protein [Bacteroides ovatus]